MFNILILKNKGTKNSFLKDSMEIMKEYYKEDAPDAFGVNSREFKFNIVDVDVPIKLVKIGTNTQGRDAYGADDIKRHILKYVKPNTYHAVFFVYDGMPSFNRDKYNAAFTFWDNILPETPLVQVPDNANETTFRHEWMHVEKKLYNYLGVQVIDQMDLSVIDGKLVPYYKNNQPTYKGGNYYLTFGSFEPHFNKLKNYFLKQQKPVFVSTPKVAPIVSNGMYKPKNFSIKELVSSDIFSRFGERAWQFFDERLLRNLQFIREELGVIYVNRRGMNYRGFDEGGFRKNGTSQHNHGRAIDFDVKGMTAQQVRNWLKANADRLPEPNIWVEDDVTWVHMDVRYSDKKGIYFFKP